MELLEAIGAAGWTVHPVPDGVGLVSEEVALAALGDTGLGPKGDVSQVQVGLFRLAGGVPGRVQGTVWIFLVTGLELSPMGPPRLAANRKYSGHRLVVVDATTGEFEMAHEQGTADR